MIRHIRKFASMLSTTSTYTRYKTSFYPVNFAELIGLHTSDFRAHSGSGIAGSNPELK